MADIQNLVKLVPAQFRPQVKKALDYAQIQYLEKKRYNGDSMISHTVNVATDLRKLGLDITTIIAALLHEVDINTERSIIQERFGDSVLKIVEESKRIKEVTKATDTDPDIIVKYILNSTHDLRAIILKIVDTKNDVNTIANIPEEIMKETLNKALNIYSPLAEYLDLGEIKKDIEENAFKEYLPTEYESISKKLEESGIDSTLFKEILNTIRKNMEGISQSPIIEGRIKSKYSIYKKLKKYEKEWINPRIESLEDLIAFRIIFKDEEDCYKGLEKLMDNAEINYDRFDDYISNPKRNGYKAMHFPIKFPLISDLYIEIQILTEAMYYTNTYGSASHIAYKASQSRYASPSNEYQWVEEIHKEIKECITNSEKEINIPIKAEVFKEEVFAFTPKNKIIPLEKGDTVLDFAYRLHTHIGNSATGAKINGKPASLSSILQTGDTVEIKTDKNKSCQQEKALQYTNSDSTKLKIRRFLSKNLKK